MKRQNANKKNIEPKNVGAVHTHIAILNNKKRAGVNSALKVMDKKESQN